MTAVIPFTPIMDSTSVDTMVTNESYLDAEVYQLWLDGYSVEEISCHPSLASQMDDNIDGKLILWSYAADQIRSYHMLERWLCCPTELADQPVFQLSEAYRNLLIQRYYSFDQSFLREILGTKISHRSKKSFEECSAKCGIRLNSCYRQYENLRRISKALSSLNGLAAASIKEQFLVSDTLGREYAAVCFLAIHKMDFSSRKLAEFMFEDFMYCATEIMTHWTYRLQAAPQKSPSEDTLPANAEGPPDLRLDRDFLYSMKEFKFLLEKETCDNLRRTLVRNLSGKFATAPAADISKMVQEGTRIILSIACGVHHSRQFRLLLADIVEKLVPAWKGAGFDLVTAFLADFLHASQDLNEFKRRDARLAVMWRRFFAAFSPSVLRLYQTASREPVDAALQDAGPSKPNGA